MGETPHERPLFHAALETQKLYEVLKAFQPNEEWPLSQLAERVGCTVADLQGNSWIATARKWLERDNRMTFVRRPNIIRRLQDADIGPSELATSVSRTQGRMRRAARTLACVDSGKLSAGERIEYNTAATVCAAIACVCKRSAVKQIRGKVEASRQELPVNATLALFLNHS